MKLKLAFCLAFLLQSFISLSQDAKELYYDFEVGVIEHLDEYIPDDIMITNEAGKLVNLKEQIDKPTALIFVYYRCPGICSPLMDGLAEVVEKSDLNLSEDYQVLTISFDPSETIDLAIKKKNNYKSLVKGKNTEEGWKFFTADSINIAKATQSMGFRYKKTGNDYTHAATVIVLSPEGKITRYLNGTYFLPFEFKLAMIEASKGQTGPTINKILQYCYSYDPVGQAYVLNITKITGTIILAMGIIVFLLLVIRRPKKKKA
ncbi:SCO family protein [Marinifilum caeruleilacunae]|uniref:SCO family protein n=1 Tax=Marinifilum caeruleilacunae TaxID=2499076 RepID=A0ABX1WWF2_9BACT|nr:SCO family protein [Marinifilum caeruleilacunae]NOU60453.1 SCO family protein [Marinifilum caeruleilacunae]